MAIYLFLQQRQLWPVLEGDDGLVFSSVLPLTGALLVLGAWASMRDRRLGADELISVSPTSAASVGLSRLTALAVVAFATVLVTAAIMLSISFVRGGRGVPDARLFVDAGLAATVSAALGFVIGAATRSRIVALLAAPAWVYAQLLVGRYTVPKSSLQWLSPIPELPRRSTAIGFLPDIVGGHMLYMFGVTLVLVALAVQLAQGRSKLRPLVIVSFGCGLVVTAAAATWLVRQPDDVVVVGHDRADWIPLRVTADRRGAGMDRLDDRAYASTCAAGDVLRVCVFDAYGRSFALALYRGLSPEVELLRDLPGVPRLVRMSLGGGRRCGIHKGELRIAESRIFEEPAGLIPATALCGSDSRAAEAVTLWVHFALRRITPEDAIARLQTACVGSCQVADLGRYGAFDGQVVRAAAALARLREEQVLDGLQQVWSRLRRGGMSLRELRGRLV